MPDLARIVADIAAGIQATKGHGTVADYIASLGKVDPEHFRNAVVGGGILAIVPGKASIAAWSPGLNSRGNSKLGTRALDRLAEATGWSVFMLTAVG
jgi:glutaminase